MPLKQEVADQLEGKWQIALLDAPCAAPGWFCCGCCCTCCVTCKQRLEILDVIGEPYVCCGGICPFGPLKDPRDRNCIYLETCCCPGLALSANRFLIQTRFDRENTWCDSCLIWSACLAKCCVCGLHVCGVDVPDEVELMVDCFIMTVQGCMLTQQQVELEYVKENGYAGPPQKVMDVLPEQQQELIRQAPRQQSMGVAGASYGAAGRPASPGNAR